MHRFMRINLNFVNLNPSNKQRRIFQGLTRFNIETSHSKSKESRFKNQKNIPLDHIRYGGILNLITVKYTPSVKFRVYFIYSRDNVSSNVSQNIEHGTINAKMCFPLGLIHSHATQFYYLSSCCKELEIF